MKKETFDTVGFIIDYESGQASKKQIINGFQHLIDEGIVGQLQGSYGRTAEALIENGLCTQPPHHPAEDGSGRR